MGRTARFWFAVYSAARRKLQISLAPYEEDMGMNWNQIEGNWEKFKGKAQEQWGKLTNDDLDVIAGNRRELAGKIQERYGKAQEEAEHEIDTWLSRH